MSEGFHTYMGLHSVNSCFAGLMSQRTDLLSDRQCLTKLSVRNLWFTLFWFCSDFLLFLLSGKAGDKHFFLFPLGCWFNNCIKMTVGTQTIYSILQWLSCAPLMLQNSNDGGSAWLLRAWFPWWRDGDEPEKGLHTVFPNLPAVRLREKRMISGGPQEASVGDSISVTAVNVLP